MNISLIAVDGINDLVTVASYNISNGIEDEYRATFKITFDDGNMKVNLSGRIYHLGIEINKIEFPIKIDHEMTVFIRRFFKKPPTNQSPSKQLPLDI